MPTDDDVLEMFRLDGRTALVTGGTRGLGFVIAQAFHRAGANVVVCGRRQEPSEAAAAMIGEGAVGLAVHLGEPDAPEVLVAATVEHFGGLDIVVNNAGIALGTDVGALTRSALQKSLDINFIAPVMLVEGALTQLRASSCPSVINMLTAGTERPSGGLSAYLASKAALGMLTRTMAQELAHEGIRVNAIAPGPFATDMAMNLDGARREHLVVRTALGRLGEMHEIAGAALFLAGSASTYVTGATIAVDGGLSI
jgi:NAD(P)-dependent dehydrogenase (short-subunit alcohol dehydrogenase family)